MKRVNRLVRPALGAALALGAGAAAGYSNVVSYSGEVYVNLVTSSSNASATASVTYNDSCVSSNQSFIGSNMSVTQAAGPTQIAMASGTSSSNFAFGTSGASLNVTCSISGGTSNTFNIPLYFSTYPCDQIDSCLTNTTKKHKTGVSLQTLGIGVDSTSYPSSYSGCPQTGSTTTGASSSQTIAAVNTQQESLNFFVPTNTSGWSNAQIPAVAVDIQLFNAGFNVPSGDIAPVAPFLIQVACGPLSSFGN